MDLLCVYIYINLFKSVDILTQAILAQALVVGIAGTRRGPLFVGMVALDVWLGYSAYMEMAQGCCEMSRQDALAWWLECYHSGQLRLVGGVVKMFCRVWIIFPDPRGLLDEGTSEVSEDMDDDEIP